MVECLHLSVSSFGPNSKRVIPHLRQLTPLLLHPIYSLFFVPSYIMNPSSPTRSPPSSPTPTLQSTLNHRPSPRQPQSSGTPPNNSGNAPIPDDDHGADLPMNMSASVMLTNLPRDAHQALADVESIDSGKGNTLLFQRALG